MTLNHVAWSYKKYCTGACVCSLSFGVWSLGWVLLGPLPPSLVWRRKGFHVLLYPPACESIGTSIGWLPVLLGSGMRCKSSVPSWYHGNRKYWIGRKLNRVDSSLCQLDVGRFIRGPATAAWMFVLLRVAYGFCQCVWWRGCFNSTVAP